MNPTTPPEPPGEEVSPLGRAVRAVDRFLFQPADPTTLGLMRISVGLVVLYIHLVYCVGLEGYLGPNTWVVNHAWSDKPGESGVTDFLRHGNPFQTPSSGWDDTKGEVVKGQVLWSIYYHVEDPTWVGVIHGVVLVILFLFLIGFGSRVITTLAWIASLMYIHRLPALLFGMDTMTNLALIYLMIGPSTAALSVDRWLEVRRDRKRLGSAYVPSPPRPLVSANLATRLIQFNFVLIYFAAGTSKLLGTSWWNGTAPNRFLLNYSFAPFEVTYYTEFITWLAKHRWMWEAVGAVGVVGTLFLELGFPFLVWNRWTRWFMVSSSILFHTSIALLMGLVTFSLVMIALLLAFVPPDAVRLGLHSFAGQFRWLVGAGRRS